MFVCVCQCVSDCECGGGGGWGAVVVVVVRLIILDETRSGRKAVPTTNEGDRTEKRTGVVSR